MNVSRYPLAVAAVALSLASFGAGLRISSSYAQSKLNQTVSGRLPLPGLESRCPDVELTLGVVGFPGLPLAPWQEICSKEKRRPRCDELGFPFNENWWSRRLSEMATGNVTGNVVLDIGGNVGRDTWAYIKAGAREVHVFEVMPENLAILRKEFSNQPNVKIYPFGLGNSTRRAHVAKSERMNESASLYGTGETVQVDVRNASEFVAQSGFRGLTVNINCEGCEFEVLQSIAEYGGGNMMVDGTIDRWNIAVHYTPNSGLFCTALPLLINYYVSTYCDGPWLGYVRQHFVTQ
jgi:FkbM family methyltransferase